MLTKEVKVGDVLCRVLYNPPKGETEYHFVTVAKVGTKYLYIQKTVNSQHRCYTREGYPHDKYTRLYGIMSELYHSEEEYLYKKQRRETWQRLKNEMEFFGNPPSHLTLEEIEQIHKRVFKGEADAN